MSDDLTFRALRHLQTNPQLNHHEFAHALGISSGRTSYGLCAVIERGFGKVQSLRHSDNKLAYTYVLTPKGLKRKARPTARLRKRDGIECATLKTETEKHRAEATSAQADS